MSANAYADWSNQHLRPILPDFRQHAIEQVHLTLIPSPAAELLFDQDAGQASHQEEAQEICLEIQPATGIGRAFEMARNRAG